MSNERRKFPRVPLEGEANMLVAGVVRNGEILDISPSGLQIECRHQLIEQLAKSKSDAGLFPNFELEFKLNNTKKGAVQSVCNVSYCRRLSQDRYHLGLSFISLTEADEQRVSNYINTSAAA